MYISSFSNNILLRYAQMRACQLHMRMTGGHFSMQNILQGCGRTFKIK